MGLCLERGDFEEELVGDELMVVIDVDLQRGMDGASAVEVAWSKIGPDVPRRPHGPVATELPLALSLLALTLIP